MHKHLDIDRPRDGLYCAGRVGALPGQLLSVSLGRRGGVAFQRSGGRGAVSQFWSTSSEKPGGWPNAAFAPLTIVALLIALLMRVVNAITALSFVGRPLPSICVASRAALTNA